MIVLLIDDDDDFRDGLASLLRDDGHEVVEHAAIRELPPLADLHRVDMLITDFDMPRENGFALAKRFHHVHPTVPVIIVTAFASPNLEEQAAHHQGITVLRKPLDYSALQDLMAPAHLGRPS